MTDKISNEQAVIQDEISSLETEDEKITRMALQWIDAGKTGMPPASIRKRVGELKPSNKTLKLIKSRESKEKRILKQQHNMDLFVDELLNNGGDPTAAAKKVLGLQSHQGAVLAGQKYLEQARLIGRVVMEQKGYHMGKMLDVALKKMEEGRNPDWWDRLMKIAEYPNPIADKKNAPQTVNIIQTQKRDAEDFGFEDIIEGELGGELEEGEKI